MAGNGDQHKTDGDLPLSMRSILGAEIGRGNLDSMRARIGPVSDWHTGDAITAEQYWCYQGPDSTAVVLQNDGEFSAGHNLVDAFWVGQLAAIDTLASHCAPASRGFPAVTPGELRLGLTRAEVVALLGQPQSQSDQLVVYAWQTKQDVPRTDPDYLAMDSLRDECYGGHAPFLDIRAAIAVTFRADRVAEFSVWRTDETFC
jgi:hypothetical protein